MVTISFKNKYIATMTISLTLLLTIGLGIAYGTNNPSELGHTMGEISTGVQKCVYGESDVGMWDVGLQYSISLLINGENICEAPNGCNIVLYTINDATGIINNISIRGSGIYMEYSNNNLMEDIGFSVLSFSKSGDSRSVAGLNAPGFSPDFCDASSPFPTDDSIKLTDKYSANKCGISICSRG